MAEFQGSSRQHRFTRPTLPDLRDVVFHDLVLVCSDGQLEANQWMLARQSRTLNKLFLERAHLSSVHLTVPRIPGIQPTLRQEKEPAPMVTLHLPDFTRRTVGALLDLVYTGICYDPGDIEPSGELALLSLYRDLDIQSDYGGLPPIHLLDQVAKKANDEPTNQILPSAKPQDVNHKIKKDLKEKSIIDRSHSNVRIRSSASKDPTRKFHNKTKRSSKSETESPSSDLIRNSNTDDSRDEMDNHWNSLSQLSDRNEKMWQGQESDGDPKERSEEIVNRSNSRLASESLKVSKSSEKKQDWMAVGKKEKKKKEPMAEEKVSNGKARKEPEDLKENFKTTQSKVHERLKEQDTNVRLEGVVEKSRTNDKWNRNGGVEKKDNLKRKLEKTSHKEKMKQKAGGQYFSKNQSSSFQQQLPTANGKFVNPNQDPDCDVVKSVKEEERGIFCNGVKVVVSKPERKILLEKKIEKGSTVVGLVGLTASEQVYTRVDGVKKKPTLVGIRKRSMTEDFFLAKRRLSSHICSHQGAKDCCRQRVELPQKGRSSRRCRVRLASRTMKMIVDLPQFLSDLQKHKVAKENAKDCQQAKSQNVTKDDKFGLQAEKKTPFKSIISGQNDSWCQPDFKPPSSGPSGQAESEGIVKILEPGAIRQPDSFAQQPDSQSTSLSTNSLLQEEKESPTGWPGQCASKVVPSSNLQVATLADLFTR